MRPVERGELRLTGGERRGAKLFTVPGGEVRPALARMRKSLFDMLGPSVEGTVVVDLFAGTGSLAFEALSRGASHAVLFETDAACADAIRRNVEKLRYGDRTTLMETSAFDAAERLREHRREADLVFVDPPYAVYGREEDWTRLRETISRLPLSEAPRVVLEHGGEFRPPDRIGPLKRGRTRTYGRTVVTLFS